MYLIINHKFHFELENTIRIFQRDVKLIRTETVPETGDYVSALIQGHDNGATGLAVKIRINEQLYAHTESLLTTEKAAEDYDSECERLLAKGIFTVFCEISGRRPKWGILTGVRPVKLLRRLTADIGADSAEHYFKEKMLVSDEKFTLAKETLKNENNILALSDENSFSLYISIPFCPTRCAYCSFISEAVSSAKPLINDYVALLCREIKATGEIAGKLKLNLMSVYIGGGTPTALSAEQLTAVMSAVNAAFDVKDTTEYTVEAGRPDTVTRERLAAIKAGGATRISINPQTLNDNVLDIIGRRHTTEQTLSAFALAREMGFDNINMDIIAGLPGDDYESFQSTVKGILTLDPESVTLHTLSIKRSSNLAAEGSAETAGADKMLGFAYNEFNSKYRPYYLYRQSKTLESLENTGFSKQGQECLYNVYIMDETHTILGCGAGAVTKARDPYSSFIERIPNFKYPFEYINRFGELISRKERIISLYDEFKRNQ